MDHSVLFVCTANICRSPTALGVFNRLAHQAGLEGVLAESAGTHAIRVGLPTYPLAVEAAKARGYDLTRHIARQVRSEDFDRFDLILAMDRSNFDNLRRICPTRSRERIEMFLDYGTEYHGEVPDPYGGERAGYDAALDRIEDGCRGLVKVIQRA